MCRVKLLTPKEKEYFRNLIEPFRDRVKYIIFNYCTLLVCSREETLLEMLPMFEYKNIVKNKKYTLEELGI